MIGVSHMPNCRQMLTIWCHILKEYLDRTRKVRERQSVHGCGKGVINDLDPGKFRFCR